MNTTILWGVLVILFLIIEASGPALVSLWFAFGALVALIFSYFFNNLFLEIAVFILVSALSIIFIRKLFTSKESNNTSSSYFGRLIDQVSIVDDIDHNGNFSLKVDGKIWTGKSDSQLFVGDKVRVIGLEGNKLILEPINHSSKV